MWRFTLGEMQRHTERRAVQVNMQPRVHTLKGLWPSGRPKVGQVHPKKTVGLIIKCIEE